MFLKGDQDVYMPIIVKEDGDPIDITNNNADDYCINACRYAYNSLDVVGSAMEDTTFRYAVTLIIGLVILIIFVAMFKR